MHLFTTRVTVHAPCTPCSINESIDPDCFQCKGEGDYEWKMTIKEFAKMVSEVQQLNSLEKE